MHAPHPYNEKKVLKLLAQGSEYAFTQIFDRYRARIFSVALRFLKSGNLAEEVVQEVFLKVWVRREKAEAILNFEAYLFTIARNQVFDSLKKIAEETKAKSELAMIIQEAHGPDRSMMEEQYGELLHEAVNRLPPQQKRIFTLAKVEGMSHQAISEQLNVSRLTVKTHMAKALQRIRHNLAHHLTLFTLFVFIH